MKTTFHRLEVRWTSPTSGKNRVKVLGAWDEKEPAIQMMQEQLKIQRDFKCEFRIVPTTSELYWVKGGEVIESPLTKSRIIQACNEDYVGLCIACGDEKDGCEPDARNYKCDSCERFTVFGAEELAIRVL